jgi:hypothetical protein
MHFIKSRLTRMRNHVVLGPSKTPAKDPHTNQESTSTLYIPISLANPPAPTVRNEFKSSVDQTVGEWTQKPGQFPLSGTSSPKPLLDTAPNYRLPFDILVQIFEQFAEIEDAASPLERILEVCHFWRDTALDHRTLWTTFRMKLTYHWQVDYWRKRFPQRADRFGPNALLDISIELVNTPAKNLVLRCGTYQVSGGPAYTSARHALGILKVVGGRRGVKAVRWRSLSLNVLHLAGLMDQDLELLDRFLQARTPNLESVEIYGVVTPYRDHKRIFPYAPRLRRAVFHSCELSHYPDTSTLTSLTWYSIQDISPYSKRNGPALHALSSAQKITYLEIGLDWTYWDTSMVFQRVKTLKMPATVYPDFVAMIQVPSLRHLAIGLDTAAKFTYVKGCRGIPISQVETLEISYVPRDAGLSTEESAAANAVVVEGLKSLIAQMINLRMLSWKEEMVVEKVLLKLVLDMFVGGNVGDEVLQRPGRITRNGR